MKEHLIKRLHSYLVQNHIDLLISLQEEHRLTHYLEYKASSVKVMYEGLEAEKRPANVIEALCMEELTRDLRPSRFGYVRALLEEEFEEDALRMAGNGILAYEVINLMGACEPIFEVFGFGQEMEDSKELRYAVMGMIAEYLENRGTTY